MSPELNYSPNRVSIQTIDRILLASAGFSTAMVFLRSAYTGSPLYSFLLWNLFLALVPYGITRWIERHPSWLIDGWKFMVVFVAWLLFLPNSFYIITDLLHLHGYATIMKWFDLTMIISFAWTGLLLGILSIRQMERLIEYRMGSLAANLFIYPVMLLNALGVYIGRYLRFNSWDVVTNPFELKDEMIYLFRHPFRNLPEWGMIVVFSVLMCLMYKTIRHLGRSLR